jgi:hypothetical protein
MDTDEIRANLVHFTSPGPRGQPVDELVLSGVGVASRPDLAELCALARGRGVGRIVLHAGVEDLAAFRPDRAVVNLLILPVQPGESTASLAAAADALARCREAGIRTVANTQLSSEALPLLVAAARAAGRRGAAGHTFTYPFPVDGASALHAPSPARAVLHLRPAVAEAQSAGVSPAIRGIPACLLADLGGLAGRTRNRWYVDADHQLDRALLFFPDVTAFHKEEACRFCAADARCDGFFATYLRRPGFGRLTPS